MIQSLRHHPGNQNIAVRMLVRTAHRSVGPILVTACPKLGAASADLRYIVDGAFSHIREASGGGREVLVVVEHNQVMVGCGDADQQIHGRQRAVGSLAQQAILRGMGASGYSASNIPDICSYSSMVRADRRNSTRWAWQEPTAPGPDPGMGAAVQASLRTRSARKSSQVR
jgi:hypothetical protein